MVRTCHPTYTESINRKTVVQSHPDIKQDPFSKLTQAQRAGDVAQVLQHLPN
jgi:hypothetical protein